MIKIITNEHYQRIKNKGPGRTKECGGSLLKHACVQGAQTTTLDMIFSHIILVRRATT